MGIILFVSGCVLCSTGHWILGIILVLYAIFG